MASGHADSGMAEKCGMKLVALALSIAVDLRGMMMVRLPRRVEDYDGACIALGWRSFRKLYRSDRACRRSHRK